MAGQKKVLGIIGWPVGHTLSPLMHNFAGNELGLNVSYNAFPVDPKNLKKAIAGLKALGVSGINVTVPHKEKVIPFLDGIDEEAKAIGAVNTITLIDGKLLGSNTDGKGFIRSLKKSGVNPRKKRAVIIGAGGSARAIGVSLLRERVSGLSVINRTSARGKRLVRLLSQFGEAEFISSDSKKVGNSIGEADIVVQTTSLGMKKSDPLPVETAYFHPGQCVYDIIYSPSETRLLKKAKAKGASVINGLGMLVYQGSESFRVWTGRRFPEDEVFKMLTDYLSRGKKHG